MAGGYTHISEQVRKIPRCTGRNSSRSGRNHPEAGERGTVMGENHSVAGKTRSVAGESHSEAGKSHYVAGENGSAALQYHFLPLHRLIFREIIPSTQCRSTPSQLHIIEDRLNRYQSGPKSTKNIRGNET